MQRERNPVGVIGVDRALDDRDHAMRLCGVVADGEGAIALAKHERRFMSEAPRPSGRVGRHAEDGLHTRAPVDRGMRAADR